MPADGKSAAARPDFARFDGIRTWAMLPAQGRDAIGAIALEFAAALALTEREPAPGATPDLAARDRRIAREAEARLRGWLREGCDLFLPEAFVAADGAPRIPTLLGGVCRVCGCSQEDACPSGCGWAGPDLCTACAPVEPGRDAAAPAFTGLSGPAAQTGAA